MKAIAHFLGRLDDPIRFARNQIWVMAVVVLAHALVLLAFWEDWDWQHGGTTDQWDDLCFNLVDTHTLGFHPSQPTVMRGPLFPVMEAPLYLAFGKNYVAWSVCLLLLNIFTTYLLIATVRSLWGARTALLAGLVYGLNLAIIYYTAKVSQVTSVLPLVVLWLYLMTRWEQSFASRWLPWVLGLVTGLMFLNKTVYLPVPIFSAMLLVWLRRKQIRSLAQLAPVAVYFAATALVVAPWTCRNFVVTKGKFIPVQNMFWELLVQDVLYYELDETDDQDRPDGKLQDYFRAKQDAILVAHGVPPEAPPGAERPVWEVRKEAAYRAGALELMRSDLPRLAKIKVSNLWHFWVRAENSRKTRLFIAMQAGPLLAGLAGLWLLIRHRQIDRAKFALILIAVLWGEHCIVWGWGRLSLDLMPAFSLVFGLGITAWIESRAASDDLARSMG